MIVPAFVHVGAQDVFLALSLSLRHRPRENLVVALVLLLALAEQVVELVQRRRHELPLADRRRVHVPTNLQARGKRSRSPRATSAAWGPPLHQH